MKPLPELISGLEILEPFLTKHGFTFDNYENNEGSGGQFTLATYIKRDKKIVIGYRDSIGELYYQSGDLKVGHEFYLKQLGHDDKMQFPDFQSDDRLQAFRNVLHDFELLKDDFFNGNCIEFTRIEKLQSNYIDELQKQSELNGLNEADLKKIEMARQKFKNKDYKGSLFIFMSITHKDLLTTFDLKTIEYCKTQK